MGNKASSKSEPASPSTSAPASPAPPPRQAPAHAPAPAAPVPAAKAKPAAAKLAKKTPIGGNLKPHPATAFPTPMAPMKLACRGADPRAMKAFIAAAISGADVKFVPMAKGAEGHGGSPIALAVGDDGALGPGAAASVASRDAKKLAVDALDPSLALAFYCADRADFLDFVGRARALPGAPLFEVVDAAPRRGGACFDDDDDDDASGGGGGDDEDDWEVV